MDCTLDTGQEQVDKLIGMTEVAEIQRTERSERLSNWARALYGERYGRKRKTWGDGKGKDSGDDKRIPGREIRLQDS